MMMINLLTPSSLILEFHIISVIWWRPSTAHLLNKCCVRKIRLKFVLTLEEISPLILKSSSTSVSLFLFSSLSPSLSLNLSISLCISFLSLALALSLSLQPLCHCSIRDQVQGVAQAKQIWSPALISKCFSVFLKHWFQKRKKCGHKTYTNINRDIST